MSWYYDVLLCIICKTYDLNDTDTKLKLSEDILLHTTVVNLSGPQVRMFRYYHQVNTMAATLMGPCVTRSSVTMALALWEI